MIKGLTQQLHEKMYNGLNVGISLTHYFGKEIISKMTYVETENFLNAQEFTERPIEPFRQMHGPGTNLTNYNK